MIVSSDLPRENWATHGETAWQEEAIPADNVIVDGFLVGDIGKRVVLDRQRLSQGGFVMPTCPWLDGGGWLASQFSLAVDSCIWIHLAN